MSQKKWVIGLMIVAAMAILSVIGLFIYLLTPQIYSGHIDHVGQLVERYACFLIDYGGWPRQRANRKMAASANGNPKFHFARYRSNQNVRMIDEIALSPGTKSPTFADLLKLIRVRQPGPKRPISSV